MPDRFVPAHAFRSDWVDPYHPDTYRCQGYETKGYEWFTGSSKNEDQRFLIDLKDGTMDRLPDVRPFLYRVGYYHGDLTAFPFITDECDRHQLMIVEDFLVTVGREFLLALHQEGSSGFFLADRDWSQMNCGGYETMPYAVCVHATAIQGDVGFGKYNGSTARIALGGDLLQTNLRTPLPEKIFVKTRPGHDDWDDFVVWLYTCSIHPAFRLNDSQWSVGEIHGQRALEDWTLGPKFLTWAASEYYW